MRVIKNRQIVDDGWELLPAGEPLPASGDVIVPLDVWAKWLESPEPERSGQVGVLLRSNELPTQIAQLQRAPLIAIEFPKFVDGRGYSSARLLRDRLGYTGELRAVGDVLHDQLFYMSRVGFDSFSLK